MERYNRILERASQFREKVSLYGIYLLICWVILIILSGYLIQITDIGALSLLFKLVSVCFDASVIILPFLFIRGKWRVLLPVAVTVFGILIEVNAIYYRNFGDLIAASLYFSDFSDPTITDGAASTLEFFDIILFLGIAGVWLAFILLKPRRIFSDVIWRRLRTAGIICFIIFSVACFIGSYRRTAIHKDVRGAKNIIRELTAGKELAWRNYYTNRNFTGYLLTCLFKSFNTHHQLSKEDVEFIKKRLKGSNIAVDTLGTGSGDLNLIVIVVESLQSNVFDLEDAVVIAPTLTRLVSEPGSVFIKECEVLAGAGRSSDGQFIINTGLLPLRGEALVTNYAASDYPGLAKAFRGERVEVIGERKSLWSHGVTSKSYGYDRLISDLTPEIPMDQDSIIFSKGIEEIGHLDSPFFLFLTTISMHDPYLSQRVSRTLPDSVLNRFSDKRDREYLNRLTHFERQLSRFITYLKSRHLYDNSIIVITGDHDIMKEDISAGMFCRTVPLLLINSGKNEYRHRNVSQLDIFPTLIRLINPGYRYERFSIPYSGLGSSVFEPEGKQITEEDYQVSELLIRSK